MKNKTWKTTPELPSCLEKAPPWMRFLFISLIALIFLLFCTGTIFLIAFLVVHPRPPLWDVIDLHISTLDVQNRSKLGDPSSAINADVEDGALLLSMDMVIEMSAKNRMKKHGLWYESIIVTAFLYDELGGEVRLTEFYQRGGEVSVQKAVVSVREVAITGEEEEAKLEEDITGRIKSVEVQVDVHVRAKVRILGLLKHHYKLHLDCDVMVALPSNQTSSLTAKTCVEEKHWLSRS